MSDLMNLFKAIWRVLEAPFELPFIGYTNLLTLHLMLGGLSFIVWMFNRMLGGDDE